MEQMLSFLPRLLITLARLRARGLLPNLAPLAPLAHLVLNTLKHGEHRGGMFVERQRHQTHVVGRFHQGTAQRRDHRALGGAAAGAGQGNPSDQRRSLFPRRRGPRLDAHGQSQHQRLHRTQRKPAGQTLESARQQTAA